MEASEVAVISEKTKLPLGLVLSLILGSISLATGVGVAQWRIAAQEERAEKAEQRAVVLEAKVQDHAIRLSVQDNMLKNMSDMLERIDRNVQALQRRQP
jgi:hypothetical protein